MERWACFALLALQTGDASYCERIDGNIGRDDCLAAVGRDTGSADCRSIHDDLNRATCREQAKLGRHESLARERDQAQKQAAEQAQQQQQAQLLEAAQAQVQLLEQQLDELRRFQASAAEQTPQAEPAPAPASAPEAAPQSSD